VVRDGDAKKTAKVKYRTVNGTASGGLDFVPVNGAQLTFAVGEKEKEIEIKILNDQQPEPNETFFVELYDPEGKYHLSFDQIITTDELTHSTPMSSAKLGNIFWDKFEETLFR
jgi:hypothetical protein